MNKIIITLSLLILTLCLFVGCVSNGGKGEIPDWMWPDSSSPQEGDEIRTVSTGLTFTTNGNGTCSIKSMGTCKDTELVIPPVSPAGERVVAIEAEAFLDCRELMSVVLPEGIEQIGKSAFSGCEQLATINLPDSLRRIGGRAFEGCKALREIRLSAKVVFIGELAFYGCRRLKKAVFEGMSGWQVTLGESDLWFGKVEKEARIAQESLSDPARAAELLKDSYVYHDWTRQ